MGLTLFLCFLNLFINNKQNIDLTIDSPKEIHNNEVVLLTGVIFNGSTHSISFRDFMLHQSMYRGDPNWEIRIFKDGQQYFISAVYFGKSVPPKVIKLKKGEKQFFEIPISFKDLSFDGFSRLESIDSGFYEVQLIVSLKTPKDLIITSNKINFYLNIK